MKSDIKQNNNKRERKTEATREKHVKLRVFRHKPKGSSSRCQGANETIPLSADTVSNTPPILQAKMFLKVPWT